MSKKRLVEKLGMKPRMRLLIKGAFEGYVDLVAPLPEGTECISAASGELTFVHFLFAPCRSWRHLHRVTWLYVGTMIGLVIPGPVEMLVFDQI